MGAAVLIDIVGSVVIGGFLLLTLFRMNENSTRNTFNFSGELIVQENLVATIEVLEYDFRKIGYCEDPTALPFPGRDAILYADTSEIKFLTDLMVPPYPPDDLQGDGTVDTIEYYLGPTSELAGTPNPYDRMLYRIVNGVPTGVNLGITYFRVRYFRDSLIATGSTTLAEILPNQLPKVWVPGTPTGITAVQVDIRVDNTAAYGITNYTNPYDEINAYNNSYDPNNRYAFWQQIRLASRNLKR
jgi:hypothetical protein